MAVEALLAVCGAHCEAIDLERKPDGSFHDFFLKINPKAEVPTLVLPDGSVMTESAAMMIAIADAFPQAGMAPALGEPKRAQFLRWQVYLATAIYMSDLRMLYPQRYTVRAEESQGIADKAIAMMNHEFAIYAEALGEGPFILGARMCAADIYAAMLCSWAPDVAALFAAHANLRRMYEAVTAVPAIGAVWARNGVRTSGFT
jgi:glutathione S-transferase